MTNLRKKLVTGSKLLASVVAAILIASVVLVVLLAIMLDGQATYSENGMLSREFAAYAIAYFVAGLASYLIARSPLLVVVGVGIVEAVRYYLTVNVIRYSDSSWLATLVDYLPILAIFVGLSIGSFIAQLVLSRWKAR